MKKIMTVLIISALTFGCGIADKGMDRKLDLEGDVDSMLKSLQIAEDEASPADSQVIKTFITASVEYALSNHDGSEKSDLELRTLASKKSIRELLIDFADGQIKHYTNELAFIQKANRVEVKLEAIKALSSSYLQTVLIVKNPTDFTIEQIDLIADTKFLDKDLSVEWYGPRGVIIIKPGESISIPIRGLVTGVERLLAEDTTVDFNALPSKTNLKIRNLTFTEGSMSDTSNQEVVKAMNSYKELKAKLSSDSATTVSAAQSAKATSAAQIANTQTYKYEPTTYTLKGVLQSTAAETADSEKVTFPAIKLEQSITVQGDGETPTEKELTLMQIVLNPEMQQAFKSLEGKQVSITGTMFHADNANHKTNVLMTVSAITARAQ